MIKDTLELGIQSKLIFTIYGINYTKIINNRVHILFKKMCDDNLK